MKGQTETGFTLMELMIVLVVVAILVAIAVPAFTSQIQQGRRAQAQEALVDLALQQEEYRANNATYASCNDLFGGTCPGVNTGGGWSYAVTITGNTATAYTLQADASGSQNGDAEGGTSCDPLTIDESNNKCPAACWGVEPSTVTCP